MNQDSHENEEKIRSNVLPLQIDQDFDGPFERRFPMSPLGGRLAAIAVTQTLNDEWKTKSEPLKDQDLKN